MNPDQNASLFLIWVLNMGKFLKNRGAKEDCMCPESLNN